MWAYCVVLRTLVKTGALNISEITWRMASLAEAPPHTRMRVPFAAEMSWRQMAAGTMTNNGREGETGVYEREGGEK